MRGANWKALTGKGLVLWIASHLCEVVAYEELVAHGGSTVLLACSK